MYSDIANLEEYLKLFFRHSSSSTYPKIHVSPTLQFIDILNSLLFEKNVFDKLA
jgi:hypothetical protein